MRDHCIGGCVSKSRCAFSMSHSMQRALPAMSLNSAPGSGERISVAMEGCQILELRNTCKPAYVQRQRRDSLHASGCAHSAHIPYTTARKYLELRESTDDSPVQVQHQRPKRVVMLRGQIMDEVSERRGFDGRVTYGGSANEFVVEGER